MNTLTSKVLALALIVPSALNPRKSFAGIEDLAADINLFGLQQPITVRPIAPEQFEIIAGERRYRACQLLGLETVPVIIRDATDEDVVDLALSENLQRADLSAIEIASGIKSLLELKPGLTYESVAARHKIKGGPSRVSNLLRLLSLPDVVRAAISEEKLDEGHGVALCSLEGHAEAQIALAARATEMNLTVAQLREAVREKRELIRHAEQALELPLDPGYQPPSQRTPSPKPEASTSGSAPDPKPAPKDDNGLTRKESDKQFAEAMAPDPDTISLEDLAKKTREEEATKAQETTKASPDPQAAPSGERVTTTIRADLDDWLFEENLTVDEALDLARKSRREGVELSDMAIKCIKAIADEYSQRNPGESVSLSKHLETVLRVRAKQAGYDLKTLEENPL